MGSDQRISVDHTRHTDERRRAIAQLLQETLYADVATLSQRFGVSQVSIRRDLEFLEGMGVARRVHGGAETLMVPGQSSVFDIRLLHNRDVKRAIGKRAAELVQRGDSIMLDSGTTVLEVARCLPTNMLNDGGLTIVTRSLVCAGELRRYHQTRLIVLGGLYIPKFDVFYGPLVEAALRGIHVDTLFLGIDGVSPERGLTTDNVLEVDLYPSIVRAASRVVLVSDSSKIGVNQLQAVLSFNQIHTFITDNGAPEAFVLALRERGIEVILVERSPNSHHA